MDSVEEKKWLIQRIDTAFNIHLDWIKDDREQIQTLKQKEVNRYEQLGKNVIGAVGFVITILLGITASGIQFNLVLWIGWIVVIGLWIYVVISIFKYKNEKIFDKIQQGNHKSTSMVYYAMGYYHKNSMNLESYMPKDYEKFYLFFVYYILPALDIGECQSLKKTLKSRFELMFLSIPTRKQLTERFQSKNYYVDEAASRYYKEKDQYESNDFLEPLLRFGSYLIEYKKGNEVIFSTT